MNNNIIQKAHDFWNRKQIRVQVMLSLTLQIVLILFAPLRKRSRDRRLHLVLWLAYLVADYVATLALGSIIANIFNNFGADSAGQSLTAFWAPFLLLHLGGPDNITSYSIEDNELWLRHFLSFLVEVFVALVVLVLTNLQTTRLLVPSLLTFIAGVTKFGERTLALRLASMKQIKKSNGSSNLEDTSGDDFTTVVLAVEQAAQSNTEISNIFDAMFILRAYNCFLVFKSHIFGTVIDPSLSLHHLGIRNEDRNFKFIGIELSFLYDILHTKATVIHHMVFKYIRIGSFVTVAIALFIFHVNVKGENVTSDIIITYVLLSFALFLEIHSALHLAASNWMIISLLRQNKKWSRNLAGLIFRAKNCIPCYGTQSIRMGQCSLMQIAIERYQTSSWFKKASDYFNKKCGGEKYVEVLDILEQKIIKNVEKKFERVFSYNDFHPVVEKMRKSWISTTLNHDDFTEIRDQMAIRGFEDCVIAWHLATYICYFAANELRDQEEGKMRDSLYMLSNYMMYLIWKRSSMMPPGIPETQTKKTIKMCEVLLLLYQDISILYEIMVQPPDNMPEIMVRYFDPSLDQSPFPLATLIVKQFAVIQNEERQWEVILDAWMEMLTYAAIHCNRSEHVRHLDAGGELLTFYWLLLAHYGVVDDYNKNSKFWYYTTIRENDIKMC